MRLWGQVLLLLVAAGISNAQAQGYDYYSGSSGGAAYQTGILPSWSPYMAAPTGAFRNYSPSPVGARAGTANNIVGASTATIGNVPPPGAASFTVLVLDNPGLMIPGLSHSSGGADGVSQMFSSPTRQNQAYWGADDRSGSGAYVSEIPTEPTLVEAAQAARDSRGTAVHQYTNEDITTSSQPSGSLVLPPASNPFAAPFTSPTVKTSR